MGVMENIRRRIGGTGEVLDFVGAGVERALARIADKEIPVVSPFADAVVQPAVVGARAALANVASGGGKYYRPEVRDEQHFSKASLRELGETVKGMHGRPAGRADGMDNAAQFGLTQTLGGFTVKGGAVTDKFDINKHYYAVPDAMTSVARAVLGKEEDPNAGKVQTRIPLTALQQDAKGGEDRFSVSRNFLATDKVPETIFGIPVVSRKEDYTEADLKFFREHPEAGGYYDLGEETPEDGSPEGAPTQADEPVSPAERVARLRAAYGEFKNSVGKSRDVAFQKLAAAYDAGLPDQEKLFSVRDGKYVHDDEVQLLYNLFNAAGLETTSDQMLQRFYGGNFANVKNSVMMARRAAVPSDPSSSLVYVPGSFSTTTNKFGVRSSVGDPMSRVVTDAPGDRHVIRAQPGVQDALGRFGSDRAFHEWKGGYSYLPLTRLDAAFHEILGHGVNPMVHDPAQPTDPSRATIPGSSDTWSKRGLYYVANDDELAAELGNLRKIMYRHLKDARGNPVDTGTAKGFSTVYSQYVANPTSLADLPSTTRSMLEGIRKLRAYTGEGDSNATKEAIFKRQAQVEAILRNDSKIGQVAQSVKRDRKRVVA